MLVKVRDGAQLSGAEREFVECLRAYPVTCLAAVDVHVGENGTRQVDAVLFTPRGITVIEVKGFRRRQSGILDVTGEDAWTISDVPADFDDESRTSPSDLLEQAVFVVRNKLERALIDPGHVCGAVLLVPYRGVVVRPARTTLRPGLDVIVANVPDSTELRHYVENFSAAARDWTADRVVAATQALGLDDGPTRNELVADGFAADMPAPPPRAAAAVLPPPPPKPKPVPKPSTRGQSVGAWTVVAVALVGMLAVAGVVVAALVADGPNGESDGAPTTSSVDPTPAPTTQRSGGCFPFATNC
ncbi:nuclease-related domain-containing protein [Nocardia arizonensis]|uniref:nuclease-related domain-containing protein n=1 Tax=Nocardia arizonensis TaxID=1141647 RepID=UPI0006D2621B|nr:nuclease-related domain-containing protein [Nocardia arizonensis]